VSNITRLCLKASLTAPPSRLRRLRP
jgi:hypothetical protein